MDFEQLLKQVEWLDDERRKDKLIIAALDDRIRKLEGNSTSFMQEIRELSNEMSRLQTLPSRFDTYDSTISQIRVDFNRVVESIEKQRTEKDREQEKVRMADLESLNSSIEKLRKSLDILPEMKKELKAREEEEHRLVRLIGEFEKKLLDIKRSDEEYRRSQKILEENVRQDSKRILDVQGEITSTRKRIDEQRGKIDLASENLRKIEMRQNELLNSESERKQAQIAFIEKYNKQQVERERIWKEWQANFEVISNQAINLDEQLQSLDATQRAIRHSQEAFEEITQKFERRINEITEMQRLAEEKMRQDWVSFRADDQKRWSNYMISQDEQFQETSRIFEKIENRLIHLEETTQELNDLTTQIIQTNEKSIQSLFKFIKEVNEEFSDSFDTKR
jgi:DNA repair exonuclease SbcCD ATPase subunit